MHSDIEKELFNLAPDDMSLLVGRVAPKTGSVAVKKVISDSISNQLKDGSWLQEAACKYEDNPDIFTSEVKKEQQEAKAVCARCPVIDVCDAYVFSLDPMPNGVWAGKTDRERRSDKRRFAVPKQR